MGSKSNSDKSPNNTNESNKPVFDQYEYNFENIFRLGIEQVLTHRKAKLSVLNRTASRSTKHSHPSKPKGLFIHKEKHKDVITLENRTARFTTYAPKLFNFIREVQGLENSDFLHSLCSHPLKSMSGKAGKSGSDFYVSHDHKFIIKTSTLSEKTFLLKILKSYTTHLTTNQHSLLSIFYGLFKITFTGRNATEESWAPLAQRKIFIIMNNVFLKYTFDKELEKFDLKGTTEERFVDIKETISDEDKNKTVKKDINFEIQNHILSLSAVNRVLLTEQIRRDVEFLTKHKIMDYSFLVGIKIVPKEFADIHKKTFERNNFDFEVLSSPKINGHNVFQLSGGGVIGEPRVRKFGEEEKLVHELYLFGIIDILQPYNLFKKTAHQYKKQIKYAFNPVELDTVRPDKYCKRFLKFLNSIIICHEYNSLSRGHKGGLINADEEKAIKDSHDSKNIEEEDTEEHLNTSEMIDKIRSPKNQREL